MERADGLNARYQTDLPSVWGMKSGLSWLRRWADGRITRAGALVRLFLGPVAIQKKP
jgi:hypothetical protein